MFFIVVGVVGHLLAARFKKFGTDIANYASLPNNFILLLFILYIIFFSYRFNFEVLGYMVSRNNSLLALVML